MPTIVNGNHPYYNYLIQYYRFQEGYGTTTMNTAPGGGTSYSLPGGATWAPLRHQQATFGGFKAKSSK
jgi:hypothetical protein